MDQFNGLGGAQDGQVLKSRTRKQAVSGNAEKGRSYAGGSPVSASRAGTGGRRIVGLAAEGLVAGQQPHHEAPFATGAPAAPTAAASPPVASPGMPAMAAAPTAVGYAPVQVATHSTGGSHTWSAQPHPGGILYAQQQQQQQSTNRGNAAADEFAADFRGVSSTLQQAALAAPPSPPRPADPTSGSTALRDEDFDF